MRNRTMFLMMVGLLTLAMAIPAVAGGRPLTAHLNGANEVGPGDTDGSGTAWVTLNQGQGEVCFNLEVDDIAPPTRAHIHSAPAGANGGIVVFFFDLVVDPPIPVTFENCVEAEADLIKDIRQNPSQYYVNIHNADFPGGAIRGQLEK